MKSVSLKELKENLAKWVEIAHQGDAVEVLKYHRPFVMIVPWSPPQVRIGSKVGKLNLTPCLKKGSNGKWEEFLREDREA